MVLLISVPSDIWYKRVYLIADKKSWMDYENFTVQIGDRGELVYDFPNWYHGKYDPALNYEILMVTRHARGCSHRVK
ncbi:hypothetical protein ACIQYS_20050 [Psychrobacillus sp. NPDC096426]|uniref:hypothetical protein n=1 Tax=Psychrobacillus sp. NPDC096426 TaxID=3364491 RepID=UPI00382A05A7